jgi:hypothetical protein
MYLLIQNPGVAPVEGFTLLGVSTTRDCGAAGTIGCFGSGSKHAINTLLRAGLKLYIYCGRTKLEFATRDDVISDGLVEKPVKRVTCKTGTNKPADTGWVLDFGAIDWTNVAMALREFVANAIDRTIREKGDFLDSLKTGDLSVSIVNEVRACAGYTRVCVEVNEAVQRYYGELPRRFLHFSDHPEQVKESFLPKANRSLNGSDTAMIYKQGVFVRQVEECKEPSLFDYNLNGLQLDESRNSSEYEITHAAACLFRKATAQQLAAVFTSLIADEKTYESHFDSYSMTGYSDPKPEQTQAWQQGWLLAAGPDAVMCDTVLHIADFVQKKGLNPKPVAAPAWVTAAAKYGIQTAACVLDGNESKGREILPATDAAIQAVNTVWDWLQAIDMTLGKDKPRVACFRESMNAGSELMGFYKDGGVYLKDSIATGTNDYLLQTTLEEVVHHVTLSTDMSRDFQDFILDAFVRLAK